MEILPGPTVQLYGDPSAHDTREGCAGDTFVSARRIDAALRGERWPAKAAAAAEAASACDDGGSSGSGPYVTCGHGESICVFDTRHPSHAAYTPPQPSLTRAAYAALEGRQQGGGCGAPLLPPFPLLSAREERLRLTRALAT